MKGVCRDGQGVCDYSLPTFSNNLYSEILKYTSVVKGFMDFKG